MDYKEIFGLFKQFDRSWKTYYSREPGVIAWKDNNGDTHKGTSIEELRNQLKKAPLCQTRFDENGK